MSTLIIPESALSNSDAFKDWCSTVHQELFGCPFIERKIDRLFPTHKKEEGLELFNLIAGKVNLVLFNDPTIFKFGAKIKKYPTKISDVLAVTCFVIIEQYDVKLSHLANLIGVHHATIIYYKKKLDIMFFNGRDVFIKQYARILVTLINTNILPNIRPPRPEVEKYIKDKQMFMDQFKPIPTQVEGLA